MSVAEEIVILRLVGKSGASIEHGRLAAWRARTVMKGSWQSASELRTFHVRVRRKLWVESD